MIDDTSMEMKKVVTEAMRVVDQSPLLNAGLLEGGVSSALLAIGLTQAVSKDAQQP